MHRFGRVIASYTAIIIATLAATELTLRVFDLRELRDGYTKSAPIVHRYDPELGWFPIPNTAAEYKGSRTVNIRTNNMGLRDIDHSATTRPTVMFVGDSFVWGYDVEEHERFTNLLRTEMPNVRVVNAGVSGYGTDQEYLLLRRLWDAFTPSVVVLIFTGSNDIEDNQRNMVAGGYYKPYLVQNATGEWEFSGQPVPTSRHVYFLENDLVRHLWLARAVVTGYVELRHPRISNPDPTHQLIAMMRDFVTAHGAKFLVGLGPRASSVESSLRNLDIPFVSLADADIYIEDGAHWTPSGHRLVANRLAELIRRTGVGAPPQTEGTSP
jgi:lysophospholipase L1-like esterase